MKKVGLFILIVLVMSTNVYAGEIFDRIRSAIEQDVTDAKLVSLEKQYGGKIIQGEGFVEDVKVATFTEGVNIYLREEGSGSVLKNDVNIEIPEDSPYLNTAKNLRKGQKISFSGKFDDIFGGTIYIKGDVKISSK